MPNPKDEILTHNAPPKAQAPQLSQREKPNTFDRGIKKALSKAEGISRQPARSNLARLAEVYTGIPTDPDFYRNSSRQDIFMHTVPGLAIGSFGRQLARAFPRAKPLDMRFPPTRPKRPLKDILDDIDRTKKIEELDRKIKENAPRVKELEKQLETPLPPWNPHKSQTPKLSMAANNASGESAASLESISRMKSMKNAGEKYVVRKGGTSRDLIGPEAVDYNPRAGEEYGILDKMGKFRLLNKGMK